MFVISICKVISFGCILNERFTELEYPISAIYCRCTCSSVSGFAHACHGSLSWTAAVCLQEGNMKRTHLSLCHTSPTVLLSSPRPICQHHMYKKQNDTPLHCRTSSCSCSSHTYDSLSQIKSRKWERQMAMIVGLIRQAVCSYKRSLMSRVLFLRSPLLSQHCKS